MSVSAEFTGIGRFSDWLSVRAARSDSRSKALYFLDSILDSQATTYPEIAVSEDDEVEACGFRIPIAVASRTATRPIRDLLKSIQTNLNGSDVLICYLARLGARKYAISLIAEDSDKPVIQAVAGKDTKVEITITGTQPHHFNTILAGNCGLRTKVVHQLARTGVLLYEVMVAKDKLELVTPGDSNAFRSFMEQ